MARLDTIRALEKRGLSTQLAEKTVELGYQLGTLKKCTLKELEKDFYYKEILQLIDVAKIRSIETKKDSTKSNPTLDLNFADNSRRPAVAARRNIRFSFVIPLGLLKQAVL